MIDRHLNELLFLSVLALLGCGSSASRGSAYSDVSSSQAPNADRGRSAVQGAPVARRGMRPILLRPRSVAAEIRNHPSSTWYGFYARGTKIGYFRMWRRVARAGEPGAFAVGWDGEYVIRGSERIRIAETRFYARAEPHRLLEVRSDESGPAGATRVVYRNGLDRMTVDQTAGGVAKRRRFITRSRETLAAAFNNFVFALSPAPSVGSLGRVFVFGSTSEKDDEVQVDVTKVGMAKLAGTDTPVVVIRRRSIKSAKEQVFTTTPDGEVLEVTDSSKVAFRREPEATAMSGIAGIVAVLDRVKVDRKLGPPNRIKKLTLVMSGDKDFRLPNLPGQSVTRRADGSFHVVLSGGPAEKVTARERVAALKSTATVDSTSKTIRARAASIVSQATTDRDKVDSINQWIHRTLAKRTMAPAATASLVLKQGAAACYGHQILFLALVRAAGVPARSVSGFVYLGDRRQAFLFRSWAEVAIGGRWHPVDPCWGENVANIARVRVGAGPTDPGTPNLEAIRVSAPK